MMMGGWMVIPLDGFGWTLRAGLVDGPFVRVWMDPSCGFEWTLRAIRTNAIRPYG
jgi:hypothetical protein